VHPFRAKNPEHVAPSPPESFGGGGDGKRLLETDDLVLQESWLRGRELNYGGEPDVVVGAPDLSNRLLAEVAQR
jgi:hypothetical protein